MYDTIFWIWKMFHLRVFSIGIHKECKSNHHLLLLAIFHDLKMTQFWSVNYICLVFKLKFLFWTCLKFWAIFVTDLQPFLELHFFRDCGNILLVVLWRDFFQNLVFIFSFYPKKAEVVLKNFHNSELIGRRKLPNPFLRNVFNLLPICLRYTLSFEWPDFGLKYSLQLLQKFSQQHWRLVYEI